jgi:hypothetical protein
MFPKRLSWLPSTLKSLIYFTNITFVEWTFFKYIKPPQSLKYQSNWQQVSHFNIMTGTAMKVISLHFFPVALRPNAGHGLLILEVF